MPRVLYLAPYINEYLFDFTSKIPVDKIEQAKQKISNNKKMVSPYTKENKKNNKKAKIFIIIIISILILAIVGYLIISNIKGNDFQDNNITYIIRR